MALTQQTAVDMVGQTQTITFFESASQVDQITFQSISQYNLSKSDYLLWFAYLFTFYNLLQLNFPQMVSYGKWPVCSFNISETSLGVTHITYTETSQGNQNLSINYVPLAASAAFSARGSPVTISLQEFAMCMNLLSQYTAQINQN